MPYGSLFGYCGYSVPESKVGRPKRDRAKVKAGRKSARRSR